METIFKVGMKVYDQIVFPTEEGKVIEIRNYKNYPVLVETESGNTYSYTLDGRVSLKQTPTLSISLYTFQGFEQKAPTRTYEEAVEWLEKNSKDRIIYADEAYINEEYELAFEALKKLVILRNYYNEGWKPNWEDDEWKYFIEYYRGKLDVERTCGNGRVLAFKTKEIRDKFLEEQKELIEIAKPLL